ncbi:sporulation delaying protein family toxin [Staphylococcus pseudoxylosus]|uniref:sporulation delaying protein family toxin n=1 Tax=Staphylococcus pseudoxylosus TaxID=2282419 RepID=UPI00398A8235
MKFKYIGMFLAVILVITSVFIYIPRNNETQAATYSGEELYRGIMFGQGEVAHKLPKIWSEDIITKADMNGQSKKIIDGTVDYINKNDSTYFDNLKQSLNSGDEKKLSENLQKGGAYFGEYVEKNDLINKANEQAESGFECAVYPYYAVAAFGAAVVVTHAAAVTGGGVAVAYLAITTGKTYWNSKPKKKMVAESDSNSDIAAGDYKLEEIVSYIKTQLT